MHAYVCRSGIDRHEMKVPQAEQNISEFLIIVPADKLPERFSVHAQRRQE